MLLTVAVISAPAAVKMGSVINNPQSITGAWEAGVGLGKAVGVDVEIRTAIQGAPSTLTGAIQRVDFLWITTYLRTQGHSLRTFWNSETPARFTWEQNRLTLNVPRSSNGADPVSLDLVFDPQKSQWQGHFQNQWYAGDVTLKRPFVPHIGYKIIGDWLWGSPRDIDYACKHITLGADSALVIWSDELQVPGLVGYVNGMTPPPSTPEWYGDFDMDAEAKSIGTNVLFFTGTEMGGDVVIGNVSGSGDTFSGQSAHFGNGASNGGFDPVTWHRTTPDCRT